MAMDIDVVTVGVGGGCSGRCLAAAEEFADEF
jgi:hypothetical protein